MKMNEAMYWACMENSWHSTTLKNVKSSWVRENGSCWLQRHTHSRTQTFTLAHKPTHTHSHNVDFSHQKVQISPKNTKSLLKQTKVMFLICPLHDDPTSNILIELKYKASQTLKQQCSLTWKSCSWFISCQEPPNSTENISTLNSKMHQMVDHKSHSIILTMCRTWFMFWNGGIFRYVKCYKTKSMD